MKEKQLKLVDKIRNSIIRNSRDRWRHEPKLVATCREYDTAEILCCTVVLKYDCVEDDSAFGGRPVCTF